MANDTFPRTDPAHASPAALRPPTSFDELPLSDELRAALRDLDYTVPTPVQVAVWEPALSGRDVVVQARTGTGKTAAFGMPIVDRMIRRSTKAVQALVLCPTRELALQVARELGHLSKHKQISVVPIYGGAPMPSQVDAIARGGQIVVGTPGRVLDHLRRGTLDPAQVRILVLDESDEMLSMGFEKELTAIIDRLPEQRQTLLFSATLPSDIERMVRARLRTPEFVLLSGDHVGALEVAHFAYLVKEDKLGALVDVMEVEDIDSALVFCNTREVTEVVAQALQRRGLPADWLNGDLPQSEREKVMAATRAGRLRLLVATDVAARGIDISHLSHVINYDFPQDAEGYVHRTGRTGRAGRLGTAVSLVTAQDIGALYMLRLTYGIRPIERHLPSAGEHRTRLEADVVESLAKSFLPHGAQPEHLALARRLLSHDRAEGIIAGMLFEHLAAHPGFAESATTRRREALAPQAPPREPELRAALPRNPAPAPRAPTAPRMPAPPAAPRAPAPTQSHDESIAAEPATALAHAAAARPLPARAHAATPRPIPAPAVDGGPLAFTELHVNVGRNDGVRPRDLKALLHDDGGLPHEAVGRLRVRDRCSFVEVEAALLGEAVTLLERGRFGDRRVQARVSERSSNAGSDADD